MPGKARGRNVSRPSASRSRRPARRPQRISKGAGRPVAGRARRGASVKRIQQRAQRQRARLRIPTRAAAAPRPGAVPASAPRRVMARQRVRPSARRPVTPRARIAPGVAAGTAAVATAALVLNAARAHPDIAAETQMLQDGLSHVQTRGSFEGILAEQSQLDADLTHALDLLESARDKGFRYQKDLEDLANRAASRWQAARAGLEDQTRQEARSFGDRLAVLQGPIKQLNASLANASTAAPLIQSTQSTVNSLLNDASSLESRLRSQYDEIRTDVQELNRRLTQIHWALDQFSTARLQESRGEGLAMAVKARWDQSGKDDPEGILFLTDQRLLFERKEKEATKKVLFVTLASELVQEVLVERPLSAIAGVQAANKGLFGHQDFLELSFSDGSPRSLTLHIDGQDSADWSDLIELARSGKIAEDRSAGGGLSVAALTGPLTQANIVALQNEVDELQDEMMLQDLREDLEQLENEVRGLERALAAVRARGYVIESHLEADVAVLVSQWERVKGNAQKTLEHQAQLLGERMQAIQEQLATLIGRSGTPANARPLYMELRSAIASAEAQSDAAADTVMLQYDEYADEVEALSAHLKWVDWMIEAIATASFKLLATESGVAAVEAAYQGPNAEPENGVLFLTDQRLLWEDRVGGYQLKVESPVRSIDDLQVAHDEEDGAGNLLFKFGADAPLRSAAFDLAEPVAEAWLHMVGRARSGDYARDRAVEIDPTELERVRNAPTQCSNCGAAFTAPILRGQEEVTCQYCGVSTRL